MGVDRTHPTPCPGRTQNLTVSFASIRVLKMDSSDDKEWASKYLLDPLNAPEPSQEDGPGNAFRGGPSVVPAKAPTPGRTYSGRRLSKNNPYRKTSMSDINATEVKRSVSLHSNSNARKYPSSPPSSYPSPPPSANTPTGTFSSQSPRSPSHRQEAFGEPKSGRRRGSSLTERFPGDMSHRPLDTLAKQKHVADRSRHVTRKHHIQPDTIDSLDNSGGAAWHHGGPYDATLFARNNSVNSPVAALSQSNAEALKATPKENLVTVLRRLSKATISTTERLEPMESRWRRRAPATEAHPVHCPQAAGTMAKVNWVEVAVSRG